MGWERSSGSRRSRPGSRKRRREQRKGGGEGRWPSDRLGRGEDCADGRASGGLRQEEKLTETDGLVCFPYEGSRQTMADGRSACPEPPRQRWPKRSRERSHHGALDRRDTRRLRLSAADPYGIALSLRCPAPAEPALYRIVSYRTIPDRTQRYGRLACGA
ncbi:hypothetical protein VTN02DRAFT_5314 [Thermoascus thermophilus]